MPCLPRAFLVLTACFAEALRLEHPSLAIAIRKERQTGSPQKQRRAQTPATAHVTGEAVLSRDIASNERLSLFVLFFLYLHETARSFDLLCLNGYLSHRTFHYQGRLGNVQQCTAFKRSRAIGNGMSGRDLTLVCTVLQCS